MATISNIIPNGTEVVTIIGGVRAMVIGVCVRGKDNHHIQYEISRFFNNELKTDWVEAYEIRVKEDNSGLAGFIRSKQTLLK